IKNDIIEGEFTAENNYLGAIWIKFDMNEKIVEDKIIFRIKKFGDRNWFFENVYDSKFFTGLENYPFGIKPIPNSKGNKYLFQIESVNGTPEHGVKLGKTEPLVSLQYQIPIKKMLNFQYLNLFAFSFTLNSFLILISTLLIYKFSVKKVNYKINFLLIILFFGLFWRFILIFSPITFDLRQFVYDMELFLKNQNIYLKQNYYNYTPIYYYILGLLALLNQKIFLIPNFILIRFFLLIVDGFIFILLKKILEIKNENPALVGFFFLNPLIFITSIHHGQFDNLAILFLLLAYYFNIKNDNYLKQFLFLTLSILIKHIILIPILFSFFTFFRKKKAFISFLVSSVIFFFSFIPYIFTASNKIVNNVFNYQANKTVYGIGYLINNLQNIYPIVEKIKDCYIILFLFVAFILALILPNKNASRKILLGFLYFLSFTPGIHSHYFALPIVFSIFNLSIMALTYMTAVFFFYIFFYNGYGYLAPITTQSLWIFSFMWFLVELIGYENIKKII
ncbi:MAG: hypothetical protein ACP5H7_03195, partial [Minisyncoccia bacterium]